MFPSTRLLAVGFAFVFGTAAFAANWPAWRGDAAGMGITSETALPLKWSARENVKWKVALPEAGNSTPIVWGERVFVTQASGQRRLVIAFDRKDGKVLWEAGPTYTGKEPTHKTNTLCSASPATDGERVFASFGSAGLYAFDFQGKELWRADLGKVDHDWGYAISPVLHGDLCLIANGAGSSWWLAAFHKKTGREVWRVKGPAVESAERTDGFAGKSDGMVGSWSTPVIVKAEGRDELVMTWPEKMVAYDPATGRELWRASGMNPLLYTSPMPGEGLVIGSGGYGGTTIAVKTGGSGDVSTGQRLWQKVRDKQRIGSGVIKDGHLYILNTPGTAQCINLANGEQVWEERVGSGGKSQSWSSMVLSGDRIYVLNQSSDTVVLRASPKFEMLAVNSLGDGLTNSSHAVSNGDIFIRTHRHLWCIGAAK
jgi:outer membrane protein assembly factor BamB